MDHRALNNPQNAVTPNARAIAGDLEARFGDNKFDWLKESGFPARTSLGWNDEGLALFSNDHLMSYGRKK
jgi:hypothetical protein